MDRRTGQKVMLLTALIAAALVARASAPAAIELRVEGHSVRAGARLGGASVRFVFDSGQDRPETNSRTGPVTIGAALVTAPLRLARALLN